MKDEFDTPEDRWFEERFTRLAAVPVPTATAPVVAPGRASQRRRGALVAAAAAVVVVAAALAVVQPWSDDRNDLDTTAGELATTSTAEPGARTTTSTSSTTPAPSGVLVVSEFQTACCYIEGSTGVLEIQDSNGARVGDLVESGPLVQVPNDSGGVGFVRPFPDTRLPPGRYQVSVWQIDWPGTLDDADRMAQLDLCVTEVEIGVEEVVEVVATWTPGSGCVSFDPPTSTSFPPTTVSCGAADLSRLSSVFLADTAALGEPEQAALAEVEARDPGFVAGFEWSVVKRVPGEVVLLGSVDLYVEGEPYLAYVRHTGTPDWGTCDLVAAAEGFEPATFSIARAGDGTNNLQLLTYACPPIDRTLPIVVETPNLAAVLLLVERGPLPDAVDDCGIIDAFASPEVDFASPLGERTLLDASTPGGQLVTP